MGSLLDHTGPVAASEANSSRVFSADRSYSVLVGTSGAHRMVMNACIIDNQIILIDHNCHKSVDHGLVQTGGIPAFFLPTRNRYGIIGPIQPGDGSRAFAGTPLGQIH